MRPRPAGGELRPRRAGGELRIVAGSWRGRTLAAPPGDATRPTADRVRQALFDMLAHAPWADPEGLRGARVLDAFAGSGALALEALSRGADRAWLMDKDRAAQAAIRANIAACKTEARAILLPVDATRPPPPPDGPCTLVFLDPPYAAGLIDTALASLAAWIAPGALIVAETAREAPPPTDCALLVEREHGAARLSIWRAP